MGDRQIAETLGRLLFFFFFLRWEMVSKWIVPFFFNFMIY